jgi:hypothetical protein
MTKNIALAIAGIIFISVSAYGFNEYRTIKSENELLKSELGTFEQNEPTDFEELVAVEVETTPEDEVRASEINSGESESMSNQSTRQNNVSQTQPTIIQQPKAPTPVTSNESAVKPQTPPTSISSDVQKFEITNIKTEAEKTSAKISWNTSIKSESRLLIHRAGVNEIFPSNTQDGLSHSVTITGLSDSSDYTIEVIAKANEKEISKFDKFFTIRVFSAIHEGRNKNECNVFLISDTRNNLLINGTVTISSTGPNIFGGGNIIWPTRTTTTNSEGEASYCNIPSSPSRAKIVYNATGDVIFDEMLTY